MASATLEELTAVEEVGPGRYRSLAVPETMANPRGVAYGGCALGIAARAAHATVPASHALYSLVGHYLGPTRAGVRLECVVRATRSTRAFSTRHVEVCQAQPDGAVRVCLELLADFHVREPAALAYSAAPSRQYAPQCNQPEGFLVESDADKEAVATISRMFALQERYFETRQCREGVGAQNLHGLLKDRLTTQDHLPLPAKATAEYLRTRRPLGATAADQAAALAFLLDGGIAFLPLTLNHMWFEDVGACSSLDFALRLMTPDINLHDWHLRERTTIAGGHGRTYSEGRLWSEDGTLVAVMTQQGILRPAQPAPKI